MTTKDEHGFPFQTEWEKHQAEPLPEFTKPKKRLPIKFNEMPPLPRKIEATVRILEKETTVPHL